MKPHQKTDPLMLSRSRQLRREQTPAESSLWLCLRNRQLGGYKFRRQVVLGDYIVDFLCFDARLVVEIDGDTHAGRECYDQARQKWLRGQGYSVIRFTNKDVAECIEAVLQTILDTCNKLT
jgi:very-short-patch-repair endonuclease